MARFDANLAAVRTMHALQAAERPATAEEQAVLARWGSWGAQGLWQVLDETRTEHAARHAELVAVLGPDGLDAARRTTINAHYTDAAYVQAIWEALGRLGVGAAGQQMLEPGCGAGTFIGAAPEGVQMVGVELDPTTAGIAQLLYPDATVLSQSFADTRLPEGWFDGAVGNVPFADVVLHDPRHNPERHRMHNHFILKSLALTRPGGVVAVLTSHHTLDSQTSTHRRDMHDLADLVGAVRLPSGAHAAAAGTEAVTDLLILRRRPHEEPARDDSWVFTDPVQLDGPSGPETYVMNRFLVQHPQWVLGESSVQVGMHGVAGLHVAAGGDVAATSAALQAALGEITLEANRTGLAATPSPQREQVPAGRLPDLSVERDGHIAVAGDGFTVVQDGLVRALEVPRTQREETRALVGLRDRAKAVVTLEAASVDDTPELARARGELEASWRRYVARYGPINRYALSTPRGEAQEPRKLLPPAVRRFTRTDPYGQLVAALENFDSDSQNATPAKLLLQRQIVPREPVLRVDSPTEAVAVCMDTHGRLDLDVLAQLLDSTPEVAREQLGEQVFDLPAADGSSAGLVPRAEYLSGNVREKLEQAQSAALDDPQRWRGNVTALREALPPELGPGDITATLGAVWIPAGDYTAFMREVFSDRSAKVTHVSGSEWVVEGSKWGVAAQNEWGTQRMSAPEIMERLMKQHQIIVKDHHVDADGRKVETLNTVETEAAQEKASQVAARFAEWVWEDPERASRLQSEYNRRFNSLVLRDYSIEGERLQLPGLLKGWTPLPHQRAAVARILSEPSVGLFHEVGAGKTAEMIIGAMELKRLGMANKPLVVVPNHMLEQFSREWLQLYPQASLLVASSKDLSGDGRREFVARSATNDWDGIVLTQGAFQRIEMSPRRKADYITSKTQQLRADLQRLEGAQGRVGSRVKTLEKQLLREEERVKAQLDSPRDRGLSFEETGIDYLIVDEIHLYKNLRVLSAIPGAGIDGSMRSEDLNMKLGYLRERFGERVLTGATATPIANSVSEMFVMQQYFAPERLAASGISDFDSWAATFGEVVTSFEANVVGDQFKLKGRFAKFTNVPELLTMFHEFGDVKTAEDLQLPIPEIAARADGRRLPELLMVPTSHELRSYIQDLGERVDLIASRGVDPSEDNMLKVASDGRKAALDMRLVLGEDQHDYLKASGKLDVAAAKLAQVWRDTKDLRFQDPATGEQSPQPGALQLVFCDLSTPSPDRWNAYDELRRLLVERGLPAESVRFIHDAPTDDAKAKLFADCRSGRVAVLIGSTAKMGVGTNIQDRAIHLMDLDAPWRPADVEQRHGRILRRGNQNPQVQITQAITEGSFDTFMWQTLERKQKFIDQIMRGNLDGAREIEDISETALSYSEFKAVASGNPLLLEQAQAQQNVTRYTRLAEAHRRNEASLRRTITQATATITDLTGRRPALEAAISRSIPTDGDRFRITVGHHSTGKRAEAARMIEQLLTKAGMSQTRYQELGAVAQLGGHSIELVNDGHGNLIFSLEGLDRPTTTVPFDDLNSPHKGTITKLENLVGKHLTSTLAAMDDTLSEQQQRLEQARAGVGRPFKHQTDLEAATARFQAVTEQITSQRPLEPGPGTERAEQLGNLAEVSRPAHQFTDHRQQTEPRTR